MRARQLAMLLLALVAPLAGCQGDLPQATEIARMRVLGVQFQVEGDETRATPAPGDTVRATMPIVFPSTSDDASQVTALVIACTAPTRFTGGLPICQEFIDAAADGTDPFAALPTTRGPFDCGMIGGVGSFAMGSLSLHCMKAPEGGGDPSFALTVPGGFEAEKMLFLGVVCEKGPPLLDPEDPLLFGCTNRRVEAIQVQGTIAVQHDEADENHNPDLAGLTLEHDTLVRGSLDWPAYDPAALPPQDDCKSAVDEDDVAVYPVETGEHTIVISYKADAREESDGEPENLEITIHTTLGEMERRFTLFPGSEAGDEDGELTSELFWDPPKVGELFADGDETETEAVSSKLVRFFITLRDQRGGFAMTSRALCLDGGQPLRR
jgi:hypothetical protein